MRSRRWPLNKLPARFAPQVLRDYRRDWVAVLVVLAIVSLLGWAAWELLPREGAKPVMEIGTVREVRRGWQPQSKYNLIRAPIAQIQVVLPDGSVRQLDGDIRLADQCRRGGPIRLTRRETNGGVFELDLPSDPCGSAL